MSLHPSSPPQEPAPVARLTHEAEAYLAAVDFFRAEGVEPRWRSEDAPISPLSLYAPAGAGKVFLTGEGIEG